MSPDRLRVLMISDVYFPRVNGVSTSIETFRRDLSCLGVDVTLVAPEYPERHEAPGVHRVPARRLPFDPEDRLMRWGGLLRSVHGLAAAEKFDLVHIQTPFAAHYAGLRAARAMGAPVIATYHTHFEEYFHHYLPVLPRPWLRAAARRVARGQCNELDAVVVPSPAMRQTLRAYDVEVPLHIVPTGIPLERFRGGDGARFRHRHGIPPENPLALFVGRVAHEKNIGFLLDAMARVKRTLPAALLVVAGEGPALPALRRAVQELGLEQNVRFVGYLDRAADLPDCYAAADVFAFASKTETQGLVLLEAMAAGLPVYALAAMGTREIVEPCRGAVVASDHAATFAAGLAALLVDRPRLAQLSAEARAYAAEWSAPERARQLAGLYRQLADGSAHRGPAHESPFKGKTGLRRAWNAFFYSCAGLSAAYRHEDAFRQEVWLAALMIPLALLLPAGGVGRALMIGSVLLVLVVELVNSAIEAAVDRISLESHRLSKRAKDIGSAAVLVALVNVAATWSLVLLG